MQINANNLLVAAQQAAKPAAAAARVPSPESFEPMSFAAAADASGSNLAPSPVVKTGAAPATYRPPGSQIDIRV